MVHGRLESKHWRGTEFGMPTNSDLIRRIVAIARECGREIATPAEAWKILNPT